MILCEESYPEILDQICSHLTPGEVELVFINKDEMRELNRTERGIDKTTDVLSFPLELVIHAPLGSIVINKDMPKLRYFSHMACYIFWVMITKKMTGR